jgi:Ca2+-binding RTX toxin-like protein
VYATSFDDFLLGDNQANTLYGNDGNDVINGNSGNDLIYGGNGHDRLFGGDGDDTIIGGDGDDSFYGDQGLDSFYGDAGTEDIAYYHHSQEAINVNMATGVNTGGSAQGDMLYNVERVYATAFDDTIVGDNQANTLYGNNGNDVLNGGSGNDILFGGNGQDTFQFTSANFGNDRITDFVDGTDRLSFALNLADDISDFGVIGNGTTTVALDLGGQHITLQGAAAITITNADFIFV